MNQERLIGTLVCSACWDSMMFDPDLFCCPNCSRPMLRRSQRCTDCAAGIPYGPVRAIGLHDGALREAVHHLKFNRRQELGGLLGRKLGRRVREHFDYVVPVPLHPSRLKERGYNQAALIARGISDLVRIPLLEHGLVRQRSTDRQSTLDRTQRLRNLVGAFGPKGEKVPWKGRTVLLVDDVLTTGATAAAAAQALLESGATRVGLAVLAVSTKEVCAES